MSVTAVVIRIPGEAEWVSRKESIASLNGTRTASITTPSIIPATISFKNVLEDSSLDHTLICNNEITQLTYSE